MPVGGLLEPARVTSSTARAGRGLSVNFPSRVLTSTSLVAVLLASPPTPVPTDAVGFAQATATWHAEREKRLAADDGWLTLVALLWLKEGDNVAGSGAGVATQLGSRCRRPSRKVCTSPQ